MNSAIPMMLTGLVLSVVTITGAIVTQSLFAVKMFEITTHKSPMEIQVKTATDFIKGLSDGKTPEEAALNVGTPLSKLMRSAEVIEKLEDLKQYHFAKAEDRKAILMARNMKIIMTGEDRDATAASRVVALDPALGLGGNQSPTIVINISEDVQNLDPGDPWADSK